MFSKIIFVIAIMCIVNATVLTDNVSDDDPDIEVASNPKRCELRACEKLCRRLKFPGGACVNGRCKCDNFLNAQDDAAENTLSDLENSVLQPDDTKSGVTASLNRCKVKACDWVCRRLHKTSGSCVDGRCKCDKSHNAGEQTSDIEDLVSLTGNAEIEVASIPKRCDFRACYQLCRRLKFPGGACVNGRCKCDYFFAAGVDAVNEYSESATRRICKIRQCIRTCTRRGYADGTCINGWCNCRNKIERGDTPPLNDVTSGEKEESKNILTNEDELTALEPSA